LGGLAVALPLEASVVEVVDVGLAWVLARVAGPGVAGTEAGAGTEIDVDGVEEVVVELPPSDPPPPVVVVVVVVVVFPHD